MGELWQPAAMPPSFAATLIFLRRCLRFILEYTYAHTYICSPCHGTTTAGTASSHTSRTMAVPGSQLVKLTRAHWYCRRFVSWHSLCRDLAVKLLSLKLYKSFVRHWSLGFNCRLWFGADQSHLTDCSRLCMAPGVLGCQSQAVQAHT